jgi:hypothetical protein
MGLTLFGRSVEMQIGQRVFTLDAFDIEFTIDNQVGKSGTDVQPSARAEISIWNLADDSIALFAVHATIQIRAGYAGDLDTILLGTIKSATPERDGADVKLAILATDNLANLNANIPLTLTFPKGTSFITIVSAILAKSNIPIGVLSDPGVSLPSDFTVEGLTSADCMAQVLQEVNGLRAKKGLTGLWQLYTVNGLAYFVEPTYLDVTVAVLSAATGLLEITRNENDNLISTLPDDGSDDSIPPSVTGDSNSDYDYTPSITYTLTCLMQNKIQMGSVVSIESSTYTGLGKVLKYTHTCSADDFTSKIEVVPL